MVRSLPAKQIYVGSNPAGDSGKASVGDNKSLVRCNLFEEGEVRYLVIILSKS